MPPEIAYIVALASSVLSVVVLVLTIRKLGQESRYSKLPPLIGMVVMALVTALYIWLSAVQFNYLVGLGLLVVGFLIGLLQGRSSKVYLRDEKVMVKRSIAAMILWGVAYLLSLALTLTQHPLLAAGGVLAMLFGLGTTLGTNLNLLARTTNPAKLERLVQQRAKPVDLPR